MQHIQKGLLPCLPQVWQLPSHWVYEMNFIKNGKWMIQISLKIQIGELGAQLPKPGGSKGKCTRSQPHFKRQDCQTDSMKRQPRPIIAWQISRDRKSTRLNSSHGYI